MTGYGLVVRFLVKDGHEAEFDDLVSRTVEKIAEREPGTLLYTVHSVTGAPRQRIFYELYRDESAFAAHEEQPHTRAFLDARQQHLDGVDVDFVTPTVSNAPVGEGRA